MGIKTVIFDIGRVLLDFDHTRAAVQIANLTGLSAESIWQQFYLSGVEVKYERGEISTNELFVMMKRLAVPKNFTLEELVNAAGDIFIAKNDVMDIARRLKRQNYRICLLSNTCDAHWLFARQHFPIFSEFDAATLSFEVKAMKPEAKIFEAALSRAECAADECFYTDDIAEYVSAAQGFGIRSYVFHDAETLLQNLRSEGVSL